MKKDDFDRRKEEEELKEFFKTIEDSSNNELAREEDETIKRLTSNPGDVFRLAFVAGELLHRLKIFLVGKPSKSPKAKIAEQVETETERKTERER